MNSHDIVMAAINRTPTPKIPCDYQATAAVNAAMYKALGIRQDYRTLLERLSVDIVDIRGVVDPVWTADFPQVWQLADGTILNWLGFAKKKTMTKYGEEEEHTTGVLSDAESVADIANHRWPNADWFDFSDLAGRLAAFDGMAVMASGASVYQHPSLVRGTENLLCDYLVNQELATYIVEKYAHFYLDYYERLFAAAPGKIAIFRIADDLGTQIAPIMSLETARTFVFPYVAKLCDLAHGFGIKVMLHSCGSIAPFIEDIIGCGVDILDPLQPLAKGMDLGQLKAQFGARLCLHGAIDTQHLLPYGTECEVRTEVYKKLGLYNHRPDAKTSFDGGFIISPAHVLQPDVPVQNIIAMYDAIGDFNAGKTL